MTQNPKLENYLSALDKALGQIPIGDRADIITEIKSHVLDAMEKDPNNSIDNILSSLGEPQVVANRYLMERGLKTVKPSRAGTIVKWLVIGFLGTVSILTLFVIILIWKFTPIIKVSEDSGRVEILGGMINVSGEHNMIPGMHGPRGPMHHGIPKIPGMHNFHFLKNFSDSVAVEGTKDIDRKKTDEVQIKFENGKVDITSSSDNKLVWKCRAEKDANIVEQSGKKIKIDMGKLDDGICSFSIPEKLKIVVNGENGLLSVAPKFDLDMKLDNGMVYLHPFNMEYKFDLKVNNGMITGAERYKSSDKKEAFKIKINVEDGMIQVD